jgi:hypothetical protein
MRDPGRSRPAGDSQGFPRSQRSSAPSGAGAPSSGAPAGSAAPFPPPSPLPDGFNLDGGAAGSVMNDGLLAFAKGDVNEGQSPNLVASAYTNSVSPAPSATVLFAIDATRNLLTTHADPNDGQVTTVGDLGVDASDVAGFDIWGGSPGLPMQAYALLMTDPTTTGLYTTDLGSGAATLLDAVGTNTALRGLAVEP